MEGQFGQDQRRRFVARLIEGEEMTVLCREFGISRKTGDKIYGRYTEHGLEALTDRSRRPVGYANQLPAQIESLIVAFKREKPTGARARAANCSSAACAARSGCRPKAPSMPCSTVIASSGMRPRRQHATGTPLSAGAAPNDLWCADDKGDPLGNHTYCYPLTVTDQASRFLLLCEALNSTREELAFTAFARLFKERGLPKAVRSDNGVPFASPNALFNLSKLAVWWLRLGIHIERIKQPPAAKRPPRAHASHPQEGNDKTIRHELPATARTIR